MTEPVNKSEAQEFPARPASERAEAPGERTVSRTRLLINLLTFQLKLIADGLRDVLLFPLAFAATLFGFLFGGDQPDHYFRKLMEVGRKSDRFINLFGQHDGKQPGTDDALTADELLAPYQQQLLDKASASKTVGKVSNMVDDIAEARKPD